MYIHEEEWIITAAEMDALLKKNRWERGLLDVLPKVRPAGTGEAGTLPLPGLEQGQERERGQELAASPDGEDRGQLLEACVRVLAKPGRAVRLHYNVADSTVSRCVVATSEILPGIWVSLAGSADPYRLSMRSDPELRFLISDVLSAAAGIRPTKIGCDFSTEAALTFMAILDQTRRSWLVSQLRHLEPVSLFSLEDVRNRLAEGSIEDFRWTLPLTEKLLPIPIREMTVVEDPRPALLELIEAGLIEPVNEDASIFDLTQPGRLLAEGDRQAASRLVLSQSFLLPEAAIAHDVMLLTRTPSDLLLILMSGEQASLSTLLPGDLSALLEQVFAAPLIVEEPAAAPEAPEAPEPIVDQAAKPIPQAVAADMTAAAAASAPPAASVQPAAPAQPAVSVQPAAPAPPVRRFCTRCGSPLAEGARFCGKCGNKV